MYTAWQSHGSQNNCTTRVFGPRVSAGRAGAVHSTVARSPTARAGSLLAATGAAPGGCAGALVRVASTRRAASGAVSPPSPGPLTRGYSAHTLGTSAGSASTSSMLRVDGQTFSCTPLATPN